MARDRLRSCTAAGLGEAIDPGAHDLFYLGGGQDRDQRLCALDLVADQARRAARRRRRAARSCSASAAATSCSATATRSADETIPGLGLVDLETSAPTARGSSATSRSRSTLDDDGRARVLAGFENHAGRTRPRRRRAAARARAEGPRQHRPSGAEGVRRDGVIGTYLHGPLLPKNAWFADWLIRRALGVDELAPLDDTLEDAAHAEARRAAGV